jgi:transcriptional/translational regulatory protein YebC/TACO1
MEIGDTDGEKLAQLIESLEDNDDVQDIFTTTDTNEAE